MHLPLAGPPRERLRRRRPDRVQPGQGLVEHKVHGGGGEGCLSRQHGRETARVCARLIKRVVTQLPEGPRDRHEGADHQREGKGRDATYKRPPTHAAELQRLFFRAIKA